MIIECSNCQKKYKIQEDRLPKGKIIAFPCKNCGDKFRLDLRADQSSNENPNGNEASGMELPPDAKPSLA